jgi:hypothetical protein
MQAEGQLKKEVLTTKTGKPYFRIEVGGVKAVSFQQVPFNDGQTVRMEYEQDKFGFKVISIQPISSSTSSSPQQPGNQEEALRIKCLDVASRLIPTFSTQPPSDGYFEMATDKILYAAGKFFDFITAKEPELEEFTGEPF